PRCDHLVVGERLWAALANREEPRAGLVVELAPQDGATVLERPEQLGRSALLLSPRVRQALDAVSVRVLRRCEAPVLEAQLAEQIVKRPLGHSAVALLSGH